MAGFLGKALAYVKWHYSDVSLRRSEKQLEREKKIIGLIPFNRWMLVPAAVTVQLCIGSLYSWSIYNIPIETELNLSAGTAANTFYIAVGFFGFSAAVFGPILERRGPALVLLFSTTMMYIGHLLAALGVHLSSIGLIYFGYGVCGGIGFGISYITPVSPPQKWFPDYKGLLSGLAVCGFGGGSVIASKVENKLIISEGVALTFVILGSVYAFLMYCCVFVLRCPPPGYYVESPEERKLRKEQERFQEEMAAQMARGSNSGRAMSEAPFAVSSTTDELKKSGGPQSAIPDAAVVDVTAVHTNAACEIATLKQPVLKYTLLEGMFNRDYLCMYITLATNSCAGLMILSKMADIFQQQFGQNKDFASNMVMINSGFNLLGRLGYGAISDRIGQKPIFIVSLFCQAIIMGVLPTLMHEDYMWVFIALVWLLATFYGGGFGLMPAFLTAQFGSQNIGALHGIVLTSWSLVGVVGGLCFTSIFKSQVSKNEATGGKSSPYAYDVNFYIICGFITIGFFISLFIRTSVRDRMMPSPKGEILTMPLIGGRPLVFGYKTKEEQDRQWLEFLRSLPENQPGANVSLSGDESRVDALNQASDV